jgi:hypothetical protein
MKINNRDYDYIDFETIKENWNLYDLEDGTIIKFKIVLLKIIPTVAPVQVQIPGQGQVNAQSIAFNTANLMTILSTKEAKGTPSSPATEMKIEKKDVPFKILTEEWNEYKLEDGKILKMKPTIVQINKATHYDQYGEPNYLVQSQPLIKV